MLADRAPAQVGQLRRQLDGLWLGAPDPPAVGRAQPCIHLVMTGSKRCMKRERFARGVRTKPTPIRGKIHLPPTPASWPEPKQIRCQELFMIMRSQSVPDTLISPANLPFPPDFQEISRRVDNADDADAALRGLKENDVFPRSKHAQVLFEVSASFAH
jgi:hypothetical protein